MLVVTRKRNESIFIGSAIFKVTGIGDQRVRFSVDGIEQKPRPFETSFFLDMVGEKVEIVFLRNSQSKSQCRVGIGAPDHVRILREEVARRYARERD